MEKFRTRLKYYLLGLGIGLVFMYFLFGSRGCEWLPENRVKNMIAEKEIFIGDSIQDLMICKGVTNSDIYRFLNEDGDVEFSLSKTDIDPKEYHIAGIKNEKPLSIIYALGDSTAEVIDFQFEGESCETMRSNSHKSVVKLPLEEVIEIIEAREFRIVDEVKCQIEYYQLSEKQIMNFHRGVKIYVSESQPRLEPNPIYELTGFVDDREFEVTYVIGQNRTRIANILSASDTSNCRQIIFQTQD